MAIAATLPPSQMVAASGSNLRAPDYRLHPGDAIRLVFSMPPDQDSVERALKVQPRLSLEYLWLDQSRLVVLPTEDWRLGGTYYLTLDDGAADRLGNRLAPPLELLLRPTLAPLVLQRIEIADDDGALVTDYSDSRALVLGVNNPLIDDYVFVFQFSAAFVGTDDKQRVQEAIGIAPILSNGLRSPRRAGFNWIDDTRLSLTFYDMQPSTSGTVNYLLLTITGGIGGIRASNGAYLAADIRQLLRMRSE